MYLKLISLLGFFTIIAFAWLCSYNRKAFPWRIVFWGVGMQWVFGLLILKTDGGEAFFRFAGAAVQKLIGFSNVGCRFVFGPLANDEIMTKAFGRENALVFAILLVGTIIIVSALSSLLYHWGILQKVVRVFAWVMRKALRTSGAETLSAAANIFMGQTEAPLLIKPYVPRLTRSELLTVMVCGMAHIAGGVAAIYAEMGRLAGFPDMAGHLLTASVLNCPVALMIAKIILPETEKSETAATAPADVPRTTSNGIDAICRGAGDGMGLAINVMAMLIGFVAMVALTNFLITKPQAAVGIAQPATLQMIFGWINAPFAWLMGVPWHDCLKVGGFLGERIVLNEFVAYGSLTQHAKEIDPHSFRIATYALCGFANFTSIAIQVGGIGGMAPERRGEMAKMGFRAMLGGLLASYLTATMAGVLVN